MKQIMQNRIEAEGYVLEHTLEVKTVKNENSKVFGQPFIGGTIILVNPLEDTSTIKFSYGYVAAKTKAGKDNKTFQVLSSIIENGKMYGEFGMGASKLSITGEFESNDFCTKDGEMVSQTRAKGSFANAITKFSCTEDKPAFRFMADLLITSTFLQEADVEAGRENDVLNVSGFVFNYSKEIIPVNYTVTNPSGIAYFDTLTLPAFANVWGVKQTSSIREEKVTETAFGAAKVDIVEKTWSVDVITGVASELYPYGDEEFLTEEEFAKAVADRQVLLATVKSDREAYDAKQLQASNGFNQAGATPVNTAPVPGVAATPVAAPGAGGFVY